MSIIEKTFNTEAERLPTNEEFKMCHNVEGSYCSQLGDDWSAREEYRHEHSFIILTHEFMLTINRMVHELQLLKIIELCAGMGWLTHWLRKYGVPIQDCIDNNTWPTYQGRSRPNVRKRNAPDFVKKDHKTDLYILSWPPYAEPVAYDIWRNMKEGQYLLFIGEKGGCTGDEQFSKTVTCKDYEVKDEWGLKNSFLQFEGLHDEPILFRK